MYLNSLVRRMCMKESYPSWIAHGKGHPTGSRGEVGPQWGPIFPVKTGLVNVQVSQQEASKEVKEKRDLWIY